MWQPADDGVCCFRWLGQLLNASISPAGLNSDCNPTGDPGEGRGDLHYFCLLALQWMRQLCPAGFLSCLMMLKQLEKDSGQKTKAAAQGRVNVFTVTDGHVSGDTSFKCILLGSGPWEQWHVADSLLLCEEAQGNGWWKQWVFSCSRLWSYAVFCHLEFSYPFWLVREDRIWWVCI